MRVLIAMSGGVDSAAAAYLMQQTGCECIGCTMRLFHGGAAQSSDAADAAAIAERLHMRHFVLDLTEQFRARVIGKFIDSYFCGRTPTPCIECNRHFKFAALLAKADELGCDCIATGHYARTVQTAEGVRLLRGLDPGKDQSYVLYMLTQAQLRRVRFPLGGLTKAQVRQIAAEQGFVNAHKHESQDICFVPDGDYVRVIADYSGRTSEPGDFVDRSGNVLGQHGGIIRYTVGQRRGLGVALGKPAYVCEIDAAQNRVVLGDNADLFTDTAYLEGCSWIAGSLPQEPLRCTAKIRYRHPAQPAWLLPTGPDTAELRFDSPQRAVTPGQSAVCYDGDAVIGGGEIVRAAQSG